MPVTTTAEVDPEVSAYFDGILLDRHQPQFVFLLFAQQRRIPQKNSKTLTLRRFDNLTDALTPLTEGVTPSSEAVSKFDINIQVNQYGKLVQLSDDVEITVQDETSNEVADMLTQNAYSTFDKIARNAILASATQINASQGDNNNTPSDISVPDIEDLVDYLEINNALKMVPNQNAIAADGTAPTWSAYWGICHTDIRSDIKALSNFDPKKSYPRPDNSVEAEFGATDEVRWVKTSEAYKSTDATPVYTCHIIGANAYGIVNIDDVALEMIIKPLGAGEDGLNQRQSMGWKGRFGAGLLDDGWMGNLLVTKAA